MEKKCIIIGGGIAGLCAGVYARVNGFNTTILEMHTLPGGLCTAWERKGYIFDGCIHWLVGTKPGTVWNDLWQEVGALVDTPVVDHEVFYRIESSEGPALNVYSNVEKLEAQLKEIGPEDSERIDELVRLVKLFSHFDPPMDKPAEMYGLFDIFRLMKKMKPYGKDFQRYKRMTLGEYIDGFSNDQLKECLRHFFSLPGMPVIAMVMTLGWLNAENAGWPKGGSLTFAKSIEKRYLHLGGAIRYGAKVEKILTDPRGKKAVGVRLKGGEEIQGDIVISAADGHATIFDMLEGRYTNKKIERYYRELPLFSSFLQVSLGVKKDLSSEYHSLVSVLDKPITIGGRERDAISIKHFGYDDTMAPAGCTTVVSGLEEDLEYWLPLKDDRKKYEAEKQKVAEIIIDLIDKRIPGVKEAVEVVDVATPLTFKRYTGNWKGSYEGWLPTSETMNLQIPRTLPGLKNFYMAGQWVMPGGGLPTALITARHALQLACRDQKQDFRTG